MTKNEMLGKLVRVHWHINKRMYSVSVYVDGKGWRVLRDSLGVQIFFGKLTLKNVTFIVSRAGRDRARREGRKNVHAWVQGELMDYWFTKDTVKIPCGFDVYYSPFAYKEAAFMVKGRGSIQNAFMAALGTKDNKPQMKIV